MREKIIFALFVCGIFGLGGYFGLQVDPAVGKQLLAKQQSGAQPVSSPTALPFSIPTLVFQGSPSFYNDLCASDVIYTSLPAKCLAQDGRFLRIETPVWGQGWYPELTPAPNR